ncbi:hypothetical protein IKF15_00040 [Candidatus Saccharibacteria bacterium]|nr:hypothetical protein [Candidatus Saccharibacteria bacterium]
MALFGFGGCPWSCSIGMMARTPTDHNGAPTSRERKNQGNNHRNGKMRAKTYILSTFLLLSFGGCPWSCSIGMMARTPTDHSGAPTSRERKNQGNNHRNGKM